eukprot:747278_1
MALLLTVPVECKILIGYKCGQYQLCEGQSRLNCAVVWLDELVAVKLIQSGLFELDLADENYKQTLLNQLSTGNLHSNLHFSRYGEKYVALIDEFCKHECDIRKCICRE